MKKEVASLFTVILCLLNIFLSGCTFAPTNIEKIAEETKSQENNISSTYINEDGAGEELPEEELSGEELINGAGENINVVLLAAVGDIMIHSPQLSSAYDQNKGTYDFHECFSDIAPYLQKADFAVGNLETTMGGGERGYSGYPLFNSPAELAAALKSNGFDLLFTANNHSMDSGADGLLETIQNIEAAGLNFVGTARSQEERKKGFVLCQNGIKIIFYAYTYGTNGIPLPSGREYLVSLLKEEQIKNDAYRAKNIEDADLLIVSMHWGNEYERLPTEEQRELAERLIDSGVDVIIGGHPHVIQPVETIKTGNSEGLVLYSLGNFISNQRWRYSDAGVIVYLEITKNPVLNEVDVSIRDIAPTWVHKYQETGRWKYKVLPVEEVVEKETLSAGSAEDRYKLSTQDYGRLEEVLWETGEIFWRYQQ